MQKYESKQKSIGNVKQTIFIVYFRDEPLKMACFKNKESAERYLKIREEAGWTNLNMRQIPLWHNPQITEGPTIIEDMDERGICVVCGLFGNGIGKDGKVYCSEEHELKNLK